MSDTEDTSTRTASKLKLDGSSNFAEWKHDIFGAITGGNRSACGHIETDSAAAAAAAAATSTAAATDAAVAAADTESKKKEAD
ncbi:hypothetical protein QFC24_006835 [Naganishia onofrii]|uniref:Uncharacterized protein n=1 Tax=Naganishia onofrii TaxID=1851511 RepID=A0ACC2WY21_9TREE|nr:hypothetical protein QFC24_006835 [Naganishia onofrii]